MSRHVSNRQRNRLGRCSQRPDPIFEEGHPNPRLIASLQPAVLRSRRILDELIQ